MLPPKIVFDVLEEAIDREIALGKTCFILDGVCRTLDAAKFVLEKLRVVCCIDLQISESEIVERVQGRLIHRKTGRTYHVDHNPPLKAGVDDMTGGTITKRSNDTREGIRKRMIIHRKESLPVLVFFRSRAIPVVGVDANMPIRRVTKAIITAYEEFTGKRGL